MNHYVYYIQDGKRGNYKIGYTNDPHKRLKTLQTANAHVLRLLAYIKYPNKRAALNAEKIEHKRYSYWQMKGEWFHKTIKLRKNLFKLCFDYKVPIQGEWFG